MKTEGLSALLTISPRKGLRYVEPGQGPTRSLFNGSPKLKRDLIERFRSGGDLENVARDMFGIDIGEGHFASLEKETRIPSDLWMVAHGVGSPDCVPAMLEALPCSGRLHNPEQIHPVVRATLRSLIETVGEHDELWSSHDVYEYVPAILNLADQLVDGSDEVEDLMVAIDDGVHFMFTSFDEPNMEVSGPARCLVEFRDGMMNIIQGRSAEGFCHLKHMVADEHLAPVQNTFSREIKRYGSSLPSA